ncbi:cell cycle progression protein 1 [Embiotoca jacksoni]|uniref:cell cycle progression protein 1 n=1 Tax=Embiotoca jacksoni TaxID=100190 RepID=UPI003703A097
MSETSSDAESTGGWTIISNEGSDIETLVSDVAVEYGAELLERPPLEGPELQDAQASASGAACVAERASDSLDDTQGEQTLDETLHASQAEDNAAGKEHVLSSSDHSDIVTLGDVKEDEHAEVEEERATNEEFYLGTSCSSQYAFTAAETVFSAQQPAVTNSSSSEDEDGQSASTVLRRRRLRKNTTSVMTDSEEEAVLESRQSEEEEEEVKEEKQQSEVRPPAAVDVRAPARSRSILTTCVLLALVVTFCLGFGHFYETYLIKERKRPTWECMEFDGGYGVFSEDAVGPFMNKDTINLDDRDEDKRLPSLAQFEKLKTRNLEHQVEQINMAAKIKDQERLLKQEAEKRTDMVSEQQSLIAENQQLKSSLVREEKSLSTLQEELRSLHAKIKDLEAMGAGDDSLLAENQRLKGQLEEEKQLIQDFHSQRENIMTEAQTLRKKLNQERRITDELRRELSQQRSRVSEAGDEASSESEELQSRLMELEKRLSFEQQRSDLWERLYVETKEQRAKGDSESTAKKTKEGTTGKVKETFDAVKNSTKEFVHHHKEQIKKAKEAVKENLRKFSDSVKSTFRHFKNSASTFISKARGFYHKRSDEKNTKESWQHRSHKPPHRHKSDSFQSTCNTRKSGDKVHKDFRGQNHHKVNMKRCAGVFDCAYQESMSLFNKAMEPIRADEFYLLLQSYLQQEVDHFHHWKELDKFINNFFHNGVFIHDQMLFTDFVRGVEEYLADMREYHGLNDDVFGDLDDYIYRHFFGVSHTKSYGPSGPFERPDAGSKESSRAKNHQRKQQRARSRPHTERKWSRSGRNTDRHMADVKIELGPMPFDPKY